ncbi:MAG: alpha-2-macroglobulin family protein [Bacteroidota bacterium]
MKSFRWFTLICILSLQSLMAQDSDYFSQKWQQIDSLLQKDQLKTVDPLLEEIRVKSFVDERPEYYLKAFLTQLQVNSVLEEKSDSLNERLIKEEIAQATPPIKNLLQTYLGKFYRNHYQRNQRRLISQPPSKVKSDNFLTWDLRTLLREAASQYEAALVPAEALQAIPVRKYELLLDKEDSSEVFRPTLYDLLLHEALDFFRNTGNQIAEPQEAFKLNPDQAFLSTDKFIQQNYETKDSLSLVYRSLKLFQQAAAFHKKGDDLTPLVDLELKRLLFESNEFASSEIKIRYRTALENLAQVHKNSPISTLVKYELARLWTSSSFTLDVANTLSYSTAWKICQEAIEAYPTSLGARKCAQIQHNIERKELDFTFEEVNLPGRPFRARVMYRNLEKIHLRVFGLTKQIQVRLSAFSYNQTKEKLAYLQELTPVKTLSQTLPKETDFREHTVGIKLPELPSGKYLLWISDVEDFTYEGHAYMICEFQVSDLAYYIDQNREGVNRVYVRDRETGKPQKNVEVWLENNNYRQSSEVPSILGTTNKRGELNYVIAQQHRNYRLILRYKGHELEGSPSYYFNPYSNYEATGLEPPEVLFFLDRNIYRPGQTVYFKGLVLRGDENKGQIVDDHETTVSLYDVNGQEVTSLKVRSNEFGTFSGSFITPSQGLTGRMVLRAEDSRHFFRVEEYKRPKFEVKVELPKEEYELNDSVTVTAVAMAYTGYPIDGATAFYRVVRKVRYPYWGWSDYRTVSTGTRQEIASGILATDAMGKAFISFPLVPDVKVDPASKPVFIYDITVTIIDKSGETHEVTTPLQAGYVSILTEWEMSEQIVKDEIDHLSVNTRNLGGEFQQVAFTLKAYALAPPKKFYRTVLWGGIDKWVLSEKEYRAAFPHDAYNLEYGWEKSEGGKLELEQNFVSNESGKVDLKALQMLPAGLYRMELKGKDSKGNDLKLVKFVKLLSDDQKKPLAPHFLEVVARKKEVQPGETVPIKLMTSEKNTWVNYTLRQGGKVLDRRLIRLKKKPVILEVPITEEHRGGLEASFVSIRYNQITEEKVRIKVPWTNKQLNLKWSSFRSPLLPGSREEWKVRVSGPAGEQVAAEMVATMYDASLEAFVNPNILKFSPYRQVFTPNFFNINLSEGFGVESATYLHLGWPGRISVRRIDYDFLEGVFNYNPYYRRSTGSRSGPEYGEYSEGAQVRAYAAAAPEPKGYADADGREDSYEEKPEEVAEEETTPLPLRTNLQETAFFYPQVTTNDSGEFVLNFTVPDALTRWRFSAFAHTKELQTGDLQAEAVTQKDLMVVPNLPRFLREGDKIQLSAKVVNLTDKPLAGTAQLALLDANTLQPVGSDWKLQNLKQAFEIPANQSTPLFWNLEVPQGTTPVVVRILAENEEFSDGEENILPVLSNRILITESIPLSVRGSETKTYSFDKLLASDTATTLTHQKVALEFTDNPAWYAVQALPYLMEYPHQCTEQIFSRMYANSLASHVANAYPQVKRVFDQWREAGVDAPTMLSALEKNETLKGIVLSETPWVLNAQNETERKVRIALLFDLNRMANEQAQALAKLRERQNSDGSFSWFPGFRGSRYITQLIVTGIGHLQKLGVQLEGEETAGSQMVQQAVRYLDRYIIEDFTRIKEKNHSFNHLGTTQVQYLYMRSFFPEIDFQGNSREAHDFYVANAEKHWNQQSLYMRGMLSLVLYRNGRQQASKEIIKALEETSIDHPEKGIYWKKQSGWSWYQAPIERQALMIEAFEEVTPNDQAVEGMKIWLLKNKQTNDWGTTRATVAACNALLLSGSDWLNQQQLVSIKLGEKGDIDPRKRPDVKMELGTGYFQTSWVQNEVTPDLGTIELERKTASGTGISWGAMYWQYLENIDKVTYAATPLSLRRSMLVEELGKEGPVLRKLEAGEALEVGDRVIVRIELRTDRDMEYVHLKDQRPAGFEPTNVLSGHKYQRGLVYYESTRDAATNFFFEYLPANQTYVFDYPLRVTHEGNYSSGISTIQCMYAPEYTSHSAGGRVEVK